MFVEGFTITKIATKPLIPADFFACKRMFITSDIRRAC